jgi:pimeloyl-ACP methyl ester carboxylesterase
LRAIIDRVSSDPNNGLTRPFYIVGHQLGGQLAALYAQNFPGDISGIGFVDSVPVDVAFAGTVADPYVS